ALFSLALRHTAEDIRQPFDFVQASRAYHPVSLSLGPNIVHYQELGSQVGLCSEELAPSVASALLMDHYIDGMLVLDARLVFRTLYRPALVHSIRSAQRSNRMTVMDDLVNLVECQMVGMLDHLDRTGQPSWHLRRDLLKDRSGQLCSIRSNKICLVCLLRAAQHRFECGHTLCDHCAQVFGSPAAAREYQFRFTACPCCLYQRPFVIEILAPTMNPTILAIDGGGVRGVIPLEFLTLIQESLGSCLVQDLVDISIGTSSGRLYLSSAFLPIHQSSITGY
ncbi:uncharacterized protein BO97DRAFT_358664, partial [Aspergillus homomorphus CBS 101889]